jgi:hypothetical protein
LAEIDFALKESSFSRNLASVVLGLLSNPLKILGMEMPPPAPTGVFLLSVLVRLIPGWISFMTFGQPDG